MLNFTALVFVTCTLSLSDTEHSLWLFIARNAARFEVIKAVRDEGSCSSSFPHPGHIACCLERDRRPPTTKVLHIICCNNTSIVSSSWWAYKCPKRVEQIISTINHSVASIWFSSLRSVLVWNCVAGGVVYCYCVKSPKTWVFSILHILLWSLSTPLTDWPAHRTDSAQKPFFLLEN